MAQRQRSGSAAAAVSADDIGLIVMDSSMAW
jgi:hypothetical protein